MPFNLVKDPMTIVKKRKMGQTHASHPQAKNLLNMEI